MLKELKDIKTIYFFDNGYGVRGGANYLLRIINYLLEKTDMSVGLIDFKDGYITEKVKGKNIKFVDYEARLWNLEENSAIFCPAERLILLRTLSNKINMPSIKIVSIIWETKIGWPLLYLQKKLKDFGKLLSDTNSLSFIDLGCKNAAEKQFKRKFKENYLPLYFDNPNKNTECNFNLINKNEINVAWLSRLSDSKCYSLLNLIKQLNNYKTNLHKKIHIIGDGLHKEQLIKDIENIQDLNVEIEFLGVITGNKLDEYLTNNADILFAMGTSMLNGASIKIPTAGVSETANPKLNLDKFIWLFDELGLQLGLPDNHKDLAVISPKAISIKNILDTIYIENKKQEIAEKCYQYYKDNHNNIEVICNKLFDLINNSTLTYKNLAKFYKYLPFVNTLYHELRILGIPLVKIIHTPVKKIYSMLGVRLMKINLTSTKKVYNLFGLIPIMTVYFAGQYNFSNLFDESLKTKDQNCENKALKN